MMKRRLNIDLTSFVDRFCRRNERNEPWQLSPHHRAVLAVMFACHYAIRLWSEPKKSGKTFLPALIALYYALTRPDSEIMCLANDQEQAESRVFVTAVKLCEYNAESGVSARILSSEIRFDNGSAIKAQASDYKGAAGGRQLLTIFDELWCYDSERAARLFEDVLILVFPFGRRAGNGSPVADQPTNSCPRPTASGIPMPFSVM